MMNVPTLEATQEQMYATWRAFTTGLIYDGLSIPPPILRSWQRCAARGLAPESMLSLSGNPVLTPQQLRLSAMARPYMEDLHQFVEGSCCAVVLTDAQGNTIDMLSDAALQAQLVALGIGPGASWDEALCGTNAVDLALRETLPMQTSGAEHYRALLHGLSIAAAPLFDVSGQPLGTLVVVGPSTAAHRHTLGMVMAAVQALHNQLRNDQLLAEANDRLAKLKATLEAMSEGLIFVGPQGELSQINARAGQLLGLNVHAVAGCPVDEVLELPLALRRALERREELTDEELLFGHRGSRLMALCSLRPVWDSRQRYLGALITLRPPETVQRLVQQVTGAQAQLTFNDIIGESPQMQLAVRHARIAATMPVNVLLQGESGVGKKLFAHAIHNASSRAAGPFVALNCASLPRALLSSELFGVEGKEDAAINQARPGKLELASGGTLLLEEVGALPVDLQTDLLRAIENKSAIRGGGLRLVAIDVRVIVTSSSDLNQMLDEGRLRADLYHRLSGIAITIPPLRNRTNDLLLLQDRILNGLCKRIGKQVVLAPDALEAMRAYGWPGNVRELEVLLEQLLHSTEKSVLNAADLFGASSARDAHADALRLQESQVEAERVAIVRAGRETGGHVGRTASLLRISRATLWRKMRQYGITREQLR